MEDNHIKKTSQYILLILLIFATLLFSACVDHNEPSDTDIYLEYKSVIIDHINDVFPSL